MSGAKVSAMYKSVQIDTMLRVIYATVLLSRNANTTSPEKNRRTEMRRRAVIASTSVEIWNMSAPRA